MAKYRAAQGYTAGILVEESRILEATIFEYLKEGLSGEDPSSVLRTGVTRQEREISKC